MTGRICVAHLVRRHNGVEPLNRFLQSYLRHPAGRDHELLLILKGFGRTLPRDFESVVSAVRHRRIWVPDVRFDIGAYDVAVHTGEHELYFLLNSFSVILCDDWLQGLSKHIEQPRIAAVGATGSFETLLPRLPDGSEATYPPLLWPLRRKWRQRRRWRRELDFGLPFPNPHLRTNAFLIRASTWRSLRLPSLRKRYEANLFEAGRFGLSNQLAAMGLRPLVVGRDGLAYEVPQWPMSRTFRSGLQENLLVADNRTEKYLRSDAEKRRALALRTWGDAALADEWRVTGDGEAAIASKG